MCAFDSRPLERSDDPDNKFHRHGSAERNHIENKSGPGPLTLGEEKQLKRLAEGGRVDNLGDFKEIFKREYGSSASGANPDFHRAFQREFNL